MSKRKILKVTHPTTNEVLVFQTKENGKNYVFIHALHEDSGEREVQMSEVEFSFDQDTPVNFLMMDRYVEDFTQATAQAFVDTYKMEHLDEEAP